jgi:hypothetical protein
MTVAIAPDLVETAGLICACCLVQVAIFAIGDTPVCERCYDQM